MEKTQKQSLRDGTYLSRAKSIYTNYYNIIIPHPTKIDPLDTSQVVTLKKTLHILLYLLTITILLNTSTHVLILN